MERIAISLDGEPASAVDPSIAERRVRYGSLDLVSVEVAGGGHMHGAGPNYRKGADGAHAHFRPRS